MNHGRLTNVILVAIAFIIITLILEFSHTMLDGILLVIVGMAVLLMGIGNSLSGKNRR